MKRTRRGVVLVAVLVALLVVMLISATIVRGLVVQHRLATAESTRRASILVCRVGRSASAHATRSESRLRGRNLASHDCDW